MSRRCTPSGCETAVQPDGQDKDDGKLPFAFLASKAARLVNSAECLAFREESETAYQHTMEHFEQEQSFAQIEEQISDEDPFGHIAIGYG